MKRKKLFSWPLILVIFFLLISQCTMAQGIDINQLWKSTGFHNLQLGNLLMILVGIMLIFLAIRFEYKPLILIPMGIGVVIGNIPFAHESVIPLGIYNDGSVMNYLYQGVLKGIYPSLIFLGIGAMTDFSSLISNPKLMLLGAAAQVGIFATFLGALVFGFPLHESAAIALIGGADGNTAIFLSSQLANGVIKMPSGAVVQNLIGPIAIAAYIYMALVPVIQPPIMRILTTRKERLIRMKPPRSVSKTEKIAFSLVGLLLTAFIAPAALPLLGMFFFGNILKESGVTKQLAGTASTILIDIVAILIGVTVGASTQADVFLKPQSILIFFLGFVAFMVATAGGIIFAKVMNIFLRKENLINPLIGSAGVAAVPDSAKTAQIVGQKYDPTNHLLGHAMAPNIAGVIGSAITAGLLLGFIL
jgi:carboxybiotin decarboxylase